MICDVGTRRYRKSRRCAEITQCCLLGRYTYRKDTRIQKIQEYGHTEDTKTAGIAPPRFSPRRTVLRSGAVRFGRIRWAFVSIVCIQQFIRRMHLISYICELPYREVSSYRFSYIARLYGENMSSVDFIYTSCQRSSTIEPTKWKEVPDCNRKETTMTEMKIKTQSTEKD